MYTLTIKFTISYQGSALFLFGNLIIVFEIATLFTDITLL